MKERTSSTNLIKINSIHFNEEKYPRMGWSWNISWGYAKAMKAGANFPPIEVAKIRGKFHLLDGRHRIESFKMNGEEYISAVIYHNFKNLDEVFIEAVKKNMTHGRPLTPADKAKIILKLKDLKYSTKDICNLVRVPITDLKSFVAKKITYSTSGKEIVIKKPVGHLSGEVVPDFLEDIQKGFSGQTQISVLDEMINLLEGDLIDVNNKRILRRLTKIKRLIDLFVVDIKEQKRKIRRKKK